MLRLKVRALLRCVAQAVWKSVLAFFAFTSASVNAAEIQIVCNFMSSIKVTSLSITTPESQVEKINTRYTFLVSQDGNASYINLDFGEKIPLTAIVDKNQTVFIERANGDNLFVVTVFNSQNIDTKYPAIRSFLAWKEDSPSLYYPSMEFGSCTKSY